MEKRRRPGNAAACEGGPGRAAPARRNYRSLRRLRSLRGPLPGAGPPARSCPPRRGLPAPSGSAGPGGEGRRPAAGMRCQPPRRGPGLAAGGLEGIRSKAGGCPKRLSRLCRDTNRTAKPHPAAPAPAGASARPPAAPGPGLPARLRRRENTPPSRALPPGAAEGLSRHGPWKQRAAAGPPVPARPPSPGRIDSMSPRLLRPHRILTVTPAAVN